MKKLALLSMLMIGAITIALNAQDENFTPQMKGPKHAMAGMKHKPLTAEQRTLLLVKELGLTDAEKAKVKALFEKQDAQREKEQAEREKIRTAEMAKIEAYKKAQDAELEKIIGKEKYEKLVLKRTEMQLKMNHFNNKGAVSNDSTMNKRKMKHAKSQQ